MAHWAQVRYMSCVSGGGYCGSAFVDWSYNLGLTAHPSTWIDQFVAQMRENVGFFVTCQGQRAFHDALAMVGSFGLLLLLVAASYGPEGILISYLLDLLFGGVLRYSNPIDTLTLVLIVFVTTVVTFLIKLIVVVMNRGCGDKLQHLIDLLNLTVLLLTMSLLMFASFWVEHQLRASAFDEVVQVSFIAAFIIAFGIPWAISRSMQMQIGFFLLATVYGRFLMWRVMQDSLFLVLPYSDATWSVLVIISAFLTILSPWLQPMKNGLLHAYYRWRLQRAFYHERSRGKSGWAGVIPSFLGCTWCYDAGSTRGTTLHDVRHVRPEYLAVTTSQLWQTAGSRRPYDVFEMSSSHVGRVDMRPPADERSTAPDHIIDPRTIALSEAMATSGAALAFNTGRYILSKDSSSVLTGIGFGLGKWYRTSIKPNLKMIVISFLIYVVQGALVVGALFAPTVDAQRGLLVLAFILMYIFFGISFFVDALSYAPLVLSMRNALQLLRTRANPEHIYLTDGAHLENLGVVPLLAKECDVIVCCDCGADPSESFEDLFIMLKLARRKLGCSFRPPRAAHSMVDDAKTGKADSTSTAYITSADVESIILRDFAKHKQAMHFRFEIIYPSGKIGQMVVLKPRQPHLVPAFASYPHPPSKHLHGCCCVGCHTPKCSFWSVCVLPVCDCVLRAECAH
eukprot:TRINITY_DN6303_c0_g1_i2.p1 TRINITY_DN6303_c0_g1~~TRINITY_DN6303_c0_g1_i2.p1  ORF type:complete len:759 (-),score=120.31 TRINITY_DN6303_c0_g1_i2:1088-3127(-)